MAKSMTIPRQTVQRIAGATATLSGREKGSEMNR
jgi:hypothetical protein